MDRHSQPAFPLSPHRQQVACASGAFDCSLEPLLYCRGVRLANSRAATPAAELPPSAPRSCHLQSTAQAVPPNSAPPHRSAHTFGPQVRRLPIPIPFCATPSELFRFAAYSSPPRPRSSPENQFADAPIRGPSYFL